MTLYELTNQTTIQGDVRVSKFDENGVEDYLLFANIALALRPLP